MQLRIIKPIRRHFPAMLAVLGAVLIAALFYKPLIQVVLLALESLLLCFLVFPLVRLYEWRLSRPVSALLALTSAALLLLGLCALLLPTTLGELIELTRLIPGSTAQVSQWLDALRSWLDIHFPGISLPNLNLSGLEGALSGAISSAIGFISNLAQALGQLSMATVLAYFFLRDRDNLLIRLELLIPQSFRHTAVRMAGAVGRELRLYVRGQLIIAGLVAVLSGAALAIAGVSGALVLGPIIGAFNMIPYFGPFIGGIPAVLIALKDGWQKAVLTIAALSIVQQLDGSWISPRVMGSVTGLSPALVLVGIYAGARLGGVTGMLFALPVLVTVRTLFRVFVQKCENI